jgi:hypothetical protein
LSGASDASPVTLADARKAVDELKPRLGRVRIECEIPGSEVSIDGKVEGQSPILDPIWVMPGRHQVTALATDATPVVAIVDVVVGTESLVNLKPRPAPVAAPVDVAPPTSEVREQFKENPYTDVSVTQPKTHAQPEGWWLGRKWTWVAVGTTVVFATTASVAGLMMQSKFDSLRNSCGRLSTARAGCSQSDIDSLDLRKDTANVFWGLTVAAVAATGALFYLEGRPVSLTPMAGAATGLLANVRY